MVRPTTIAKFVPRERALTPVEIDLMYKYMNRIGTSPQYRAAIKLLLLVQSMCFLRVMIQIRR